MTTINNIHVIVADTSQGSFDVFQLLPVVSPLAPPLWNHRWLFSY